MKNGNTFKVDVAALERVGKKIGDIPADVDRLMEARTKAATSIIWRTAHAKRPMISKSQMKLEGRSKRVSDPTAEVGVPVQTGRLQASIVQRVERVAGRFRGVVETAGVPYMAFIEYGTSRMKARPFMRPAVAINKEVIKKMYGMNARLMAKIA